jgi:3-oxoacyl-[acyl-carrier protein] reductase
MPRAETKTESRRSPKWQARREAIIDTSARVFARRGYHATGISELCEENDLGKGALYHYIGSKEELLAAIHDRVMDEVLLGAARVKDAGGSPPDQLAALGEELLDVIHRYPDHVWVFLHEFPALTGERAAKFRERRREYEKSVETVLADVSDPEQVDAVVAHAVDRFGRLDVLISNAGVLSPNGRIHNLTIDDWDRCYRVNVLGSVNGIRAAVNVMRPQKSGSIILTASVAGMTAWSHAAPYCATKAAVIQLAKVAAVEYARDGIRVNCVCPGTFRSAIHEGLPDEAMDAMAARHPLGLGTADDLAGAYAYLASDASRWTTGSALVVDGGYSAP